MSNGIRRVSVGIDGTVGNGSSFRACLSADGRHVAFSSYASNLVAGDTPGTLDVFVRDMMTGATERVSRSSSGQAGTGPSDFAALSGDGRYVAFQSLDSALVPGDRNGVPDVFLHDRDTGTTVCLSRNLGGGAANGGSYAPQVLADGSRIIFRSDASNLVAGDTNGVTDTFAWDLATGTLSRLAATGPLAPVLGDAVYAAPSANGRLVVFTAEEQGPAAAGVTSVFVEDRLTGRVERVSVSSDGVVGNAESGPAAISANGRYVAFESKASNLVAGDTNRVSDIFLHDRVTGETTRISASPAGTQGNNASSEPGISADGRFVVYHSLAGNLVAGDGNPGQDVFVHDRLSGQTALVSVNAMGVQSGHRSFSASISADGESIAFHSWAPNLASGDSNSLPDVYVLSNPLLAGARATFTGTQERDRLYGSDADDLLIGLGGADSLHGGVRADSLFGNYGNDRLHGDEGSDLLVGGLHDDVLFGGTNIDRLLGGQGADMLFGGEGADCFAFRSAREADGDTIRDFRPGEDVIRIYGFADGQVPAWRGAAAFSGTAAEIRAERSGGVTLVAGDLDGDGLSDFVLRVTGTASLDADDFAF